MSEPIDSKLKSPVTLLTPKFHGNSLICPFLSPLTAKTRTHENSEQSIWCNEYVGDILDSLKQSEKRRKRLDYKSRQTSFRSSLLMLMKTATDCFSLSRTTLHLGVYLLDCFMDTYTIVIEKLNATALMCILIASKLEENDQNVPRFSKLNELVGNVYTMGDFKSVEKKIVSSFKYDFIYPTAATFVESYSNQLVTIDDYLSHNAHCSCSKIPYIFPNFESMILETTSLLFCILDISLHDYRLVNLTPSLIGAACLATTRSLRRIEPIWTERLVLLTGYNFETIFPYVEALKALYALHGNKEYGCDSPDSGIASDSKSESEEDDSDVYDYQPKIKRRRMFE